MVTARRNKSYSNGEGRPVEWERVLTGTRKGEKIVVFRHLRNIAKKKATIIYVMSVRLSVPWKKTLLLL